MARSIHKLWRGQYSLPVTFWGFYVFGYLVTYLLVALISPQFNTQPWRLLSVLILILPYNILSAVGLFRSADAYPRTRWRWGAVAQICLCLWEARVAWSLANGTIRAIGEFGAASN